MVERIIIAHDYVEGSASTNRIIGFAKGYRNCGREVILMLLSSDKSIDLSLEGIDVRVFTEPPIQSRIVRKLVAIRKYIRAIKQLYIPKATVIHIYRTPWWGFFFNRKKYDFFFERGEIPFFSERKSLSYLIQEVLGLWVTKRSAGILAQTYSLKDYYQNYGVKNIEVINMFVDTSRFLGLQLDKADKYIAYCGTICNQKDGIDVLIRAFGIVHREFPEYSLYLIGGFERLYGDEQSIRALVTELGLDDVVRFTGRLSPSEIPSLLLNASILTMARPENKQTRYGFPTKLGEYLCTGNPVVLTPVGEVGLYLKDGVNCVFAKPGDIDDYASKLRWVITHKEESERIGLAGRSLIDTDFSINTQTSKAVAFFERVQGS